DAELVKQETERLLEIGGECIPRRLGQVPHLAPERADGPLPRLIIERLRGSPVLCLALGVLAQPGVDPAPQLPRKLLVVKDDALEIRCEVNLRRLDPGKVPERIGWKRARAMLDRASHPIPASRLGQSLEG